MTAMNSNQKVTGRTGSYKNIFQFNALFDNSLNVFASGQGPECILILSILVAKM